MEKILILLISVITLYSCNNDDDKNGNKASEVNIRLSNVSQFDYQNTVVNTSTGNVDFNNIGSGEKTDYKKFQIAYSYAFVQLEIEGETYTIQPIDYVGERPLEKGNYTYEIDAIESQEGNINLNLTLITE